MVKNSHLKNRFVVKGNFICLCFIFNKVVRWNAPDYHFSAGYFGILDISF